MKKKVLILTAVLLWTAAAFAQNFQTIIPYDSPEVNNLTLLYRELGMALPSETAPWTEAEFLIMLDRVQRRSGELSSTGKDMLAGLRESLKKDPMYSESGGDFAADVNFNVALEGYLGLIGNEDERTWVRGYGEREPLLYMPAEGWFYDSFYAMTSLTIQQDYLAVLGEQGSGTTLPTDFNLIDSNYPYHTALSWGGEHWNVRFARESLNWGSGKTGNLLIGANGVSHDFFEATTFWERFKFTFLWLGMANYEWWDDVNEDGVVDAGEIETYTVGGQTFYKPVYENKSDFFSAFSSQETLRHFLAHRMEFRFSDQFNFTFTEAVMYQDPSFQFRYLNPLMAFHNWYQTGSANYFITLEGDYQLLPGVRLYGQFLGDQIAFYFNRQDGTYSDVPPAMGYLAGLDLSRELSGGYLYGGLEWVKLDPYNYIDRSGINLWYEQWIMSNYIGGHPVLVIQPLGYEKGPDSMTFYGEIGYKVPDVWEAKLSCDYSLKGKNEITTEWSDDEGEAEKTTPSGSNPIQNLTLTLGSSLSGQVVNLPEDMTLGSSLSWVYINNYNHIKNKKIFDLQLSASVSFQF